MGAHYHHLQPKDRLQIYELLFQGKAIADIADKVGYHRSTIHRELESNSSGMGYRPDWACQQYLARRWKRSAKLEDLPELKQIIIDKLQQGWSPDQIAGRLKGRHNKPIISRETIYRYIYSPQGIKLKLYKYLQEQRKFRYPRIKRRRRTIANSRKTPIKERSQMINERQSIGHWEGDLLLFRYTKTNLFTLRERKSRLIVAIKNVSREAKTTAQTMINYMKKNLRHSLDTLTLDNDPAFALHEKIADQMRAKIYFCEPYKSYQKGSIENANRLLRTQLPRHILIDKLKQTDIDNITRKLNDRPMRCLNYKTPREVFYSCFNKPASLMACCT